MIADRYSFEAEMPDGSVITTGGDLGGAVRVSIIPQNGTHLPRHDFIGQGFVRRFKRSFKRCPVGGFDKEKYFAEIENRITESRIAAREARDLTGKRPKIQRQPQAKSSKLDECFEVVCNEGYRIYIRHIDGALLITPPNYELYI